MKEEFKTSGNLFDLGILKRLFQFAKPYMAWFYLLIGLTILTAVIGPIRPLLIQHTVDHEIRNSDFQGLNKMVLFLVLALVAHAIIDYFHTYLAAWLGQNIIKDIRIKLFKKLVTFRLKFFDHTPIGRLVTRNISDIETLADVFSEGLAAIAGDLLQLIVILSLMFYTSWKLTLVSLSMLPLLLLSTYVFKEKIKVSFNEVRTAVANLNSFVQEHITGIAIVQIFNSEAREYKKFVAINEEHKKANLKSVLYYAVYFPVAEIIGAAGTGLLVWYGSTQAIENVKMLPNDVTIGTLIAFIMYLSMFFRPIRMIADRFNTLQMGIVSSGRIFNLLDNNDDMMKGGTLHPQQMQGKIEFRKVWFAYNDEQYILKDINFDVAVGQTVALVGATGAGKSSVINLLNRFYDINKGDLLIDGKNIKEYQIEFLRENIAVVLQDVFLFSDTIYNNITLNNPSISKAQVMETAAMVGAAGFIEKLPGGLDYNVMERGNTLSVGQRQLISFIRALVYDPKIIILDEATSSVDTETEDLIQKAIDKLMKNRTAIIIAHRLSTIQKANKILVFDKGEIKESGTHSELLEKQGIYFQLNKNQFKKEKQSQIL